MTKLDHELQRSVMSPGVASVAGLGAAAAIAYAVMIHGVPALVADTGLTLPSPNEWLSARPEIAAAVNAGLLLLLYVGVLLLNSRFYLLRSRSATFASLMLLMVSATPMYATALQGGALQAVVVLASMALMYSAYGRPAATHSVFGVFALLGVATLFSPAMIVYTPVMLLGCAQMRILTPRAIVAALLGILLGVWLQWAFFPALYPDFHLPRYTWLELRTPPLALLRAYGPMLVMALLCLILTVFNLLKVIGYNAHARALNGLLTIVSVATALTVLIWPAATQGLYVTLAMCTAMQVGHTTAVYSAARGYVAMLLALIIFAAFTIWQL